MEEEALDPVRQVLVMRRKFPDGKGGDTKLRTGKYVAQGAHGAQMFVQDQVRPQLLAQIGLDAAEAHTQREVMAALALAKAQWEDFEASVEQASMAQGVDALRGGFSLHLSDEEAIWMATEYGKIAVYVDSEEELLAVREAALGAGLTAHLVTDLGHTEFHGVPTLTCLAVGPHFASRMQPVTGHLPLL